MQLFQIFYVTEKVIIKNISFKGRKLVDYLNI